MKSDRIMTWNRWWSWLQRNWPRSTPRVRRSVRAVDYRERISVATWPLVVGLGLSLFFELPPIEFSFWALGSPVAIPITSTFVAALFLAVLAATGVESVISAHPRFLTSLQRRAGRTWPFWALPMALMIISTVLLPLAPTGLLRVLALLLTTAILVATFFSLYTTVEPGQPGFRRGRLVLNSLAYGSALLLFLFVYQTRIRSLVSGTVVAGTAALLAIELLRSSTGRTSTVLGYGAIVGVILGQVTWALNYWPVPDITGGLLLLLIFYLLVSFAQHDLEGHLTRRVAIEFALFAIVALLLIYLVGPGFSVFDHQISDINGL